MNQTWVRPLCVLVCAPLLAMPAMGAPAAHEAEVRAFVDDSCIIADEPFIVPASTKPDQGTAKFLPLIG